MMIELKDANAVYEQVKEGNCIYYRDPEYPSNFQKFDKVWVDEYGSWK